MALGNSRSSLTFSLEYRQILAPSSLHDCEERNALNDRHLARRSPRSASEQVGFKVGKIKKLGWK